MQPISSIDTKKDAHEMQYDRSVSTAFRNISFGNIDTTGAVQLDNMLGYWWSGTSSSSMVITHNLGHPPVGYLIMSKSAPCDVSYVGADDTTITLSANVSGVIINIFILG